MGLMDKLDSPEFAMYLASTGGGSPFGMQPGNMMMMRMMMEKREREKLSSLMENFPVSEPPAMPSQAMGGAPGGAPMPAPKPGLMDRLGNSSWWGATLDNSPGLPFALMGAGQNMQQQGKRKPPPPIPKTPLNNPAVVQALLQMIQRNMARGPGAPQFRRN